jgi:hypothetical protein
LVAFFFIVKALGWTVGGMNTWGHLLLWYGIGAAAAAVHMVVLVVRKRGCSNRPGKSRSG